YRLLAQRLVEGVRARERHQEQNTQQETSRHKLPSEENCQNCQICNCQNCKIKGLESIVSFTTAHCAVCAKLAAVYPPLLRCCSGPVRYAGVHRLFPRPTVPSG